MSVEDEKMPPLPQHTPPVAQGVGGLFRFDTAWMQWFIQVKLKIDTINANTVGISKVSGQGFAVRDSNGAWLQRVLSGVVNRIDVTNPDGELGNPVVDISATYEGQVSITKLGTITVGIWNGSVIGPDYGGTGLASGTAAAPAMTNTSTSATGGSAASLPAQPVGYVDVVVGGVTKKMAYYD